MTGVAWYLHDTTSDPPKHPDHGRMSQACVPFPMWLRQLAHHAKISARTRNVLALLGTGPRPHLWPRQLNIHRTMAHCSMGSINSTWLATLPQNLPKKEQVSLAAYTSCNHANVSPVYEALPHENRGLIDTSSHQTHED